MARQHHQQTSDKEQFWRDMLLLWQSSGQTIRAFCHAQRLSEPSFYGWRRRISERQQPAFVPVRVTPTPSTSIPLELVLASGRVVRVPPGFDGDTLRQLLDILHDVPEDASC